MKSSNKSKRGRKPLPLMWSRVLDLNQAEAPPANEYGIEVDTEHMMDNMIPAPNRGKKQWRPLFHPKDWWRENENRDLGQNQLSRRVLKANAKNAVDMRRLLLDRCK